MTPFDFVNGRGQRVVFDGADVTVDGVLVPRDQRWFWTPDWQRGEDEADADIAAGRVRRFASSAEAIAYLNESS